MKTCQNEVSSRDWLRIDPEAFRHISAMLTFEPRMQDEDVEIDRSRGATLVSVFT